MDSWGEPTHDSWGGADANNDSWGAPATNAQDTWGNDDDNGFIPQNPNEINEDFADLSITTNGNENNNENENENEDENNQDKNKDNETSVISDKNDKNNKNENESKTDNTNKDNIDNNNESKIDNNNNNNSNNESPNKNKKRRKKKKSKKGEKRRCTGCKEHHPIEEMKMHDKTKAWYCKECSKKLKCMDCKKYVDPDMGKADEYGSWYCFNCWKKFTDAQTASYKAEDPEQFMSGKMKNYEKSLYKQW